MELAEQYHTPVIFSAIGIESYDEDNPKCQRLKKTLNFNCVKQITTRDGFSYLKKYKTREDLVIDKVSDPAVFASTVFKEYIQPKQKKIGIFVLRGNGFKDNKINFSKQDAASMWLDLLQILTTHQYDYELLTSGHFGDEAFLDYLIRTHNVPASKCIFNINSPEDLIHKISSYDAIVSCRLHPSIISFSFDVPSVGLIWNSKVSYFYEDIGYKQRLVDVLSSSPDNIVEKLEQSKIEGVKKDPNYLMSVYLTLFNGIRNIIAPSAQNITPYGYTELLANIPPYPGTSNKEQLEKLKRKFRRTYGKYNDLFEQNTNNKKKIKGLQKELNKCGIKYIIKKELKRLPFFH